ncbi:MAG: lipoate protein ligase C-terminal domain-containing protein [Acidilobus sp.]
MGVCEVKARKGLIRAKVTIRDGKIEEASITGDFILLPEDAVFQLELRLQGIEASGGRVAVAVREALSSAEIVGASVEDFLDAIICAIRGET